ncbi:MAG: hypothetical protein JXR48_17240 [Candidatus Delongbacteria bacterium]|nr:hypothetical protein [Candidatus Delongbacteria bacterium]MBN2836704.1 hypothetical protein [Candidatus Delongbacteria bacterium]
MKKNLFLLSSIALMVLLFACSKQNDLDFKIEQIDIDGDISYLPLAGPVSIKKFIIDDVSDSISPENGGKGFEKIAFELGWDTEVYSTVNDQNLVVKGGVFRRGFPDFPITLRPYGKFSHTALNARINALLYDKLLNFDDLNNRYYPSLVSHWKIDKKNKCFYFRLDPEARWSNGLEVTSADVIATWKLLVNENIYDITQNNIYKRFKEPIAVSKYIFKITPYEFQDNLFSDISEIYLLPEFSLSKVTSENFLEHYNFIQVMGSGPYVIDKIKSVKGNRLVFRRRIDYWGSFKRHNRGLFNFDQIDFVVIREYSMMLEKLKKGEIDYMDLTRTDDWYDIFNPDKPGLGLSKKMKNNVIVCKEVYNGAPKVFSGIALNTLLPPLNDKLIRKALAYAYNRDLLNKLFFKNEMKFILSYYPGSEYEGLKNTIYNFDLQKADSLLDLTKWKKKNSNGLRIDDDGNVLSFTLTVSQQNEKYYTIYQEDLKKIGINLNLRKGDFKTIASEIDSRKYLMARIAYLMGKEPTAHNLLKTSGSGVPNSTNITGFCDPVIDSLGLLISNTDIVEEKKKYTTVIDSILTDNVPYILQMYQDYNCRIAYWNKYGMPKSVFTYLGTHSTVHTFWWILPDNEKLLIDYDDNKNIVFPEEERLVDYWGFLKK